MHLQHPDLLRRAEGILSTLAGNADCVPPKNRDWWSSYLRSHSSHFLELLALLRGCGEVRSVLDVGNFPGQFTILLKQLDLEVAGIDLDPGRAGGLWERFDIVEKRADVEKDPFPFDPSSFDVVVLSEVLEHLGVNAIHALRECHRMLRSGGHLILSVPNVTLRHRVRFLFGRDYQGDIVQEFRSLETLGHMGHFRLYSHREISSLLEYAGFEPRVAKVAGWLPGGKWRFLRYLGPFRDHFRSHFYAVAQRSVG